MVFDAFTSEEWSTRLESKWMGYQFDSETLWSNNFFFLVNKGKSLRSSVCWVNYVRGSASYFCFPFFVQQCYHFKTVLFSMVPNISLGFINQKALSFLQSLIYVYYFFTQNLAILIISHILPLSFLLTDVNFLLQS